MTSKRNVAVSCVLAVMLAGCWSGIRETVKKDQLVFSHQGVTLTYQTYYQHLPGNDWAPYKYRHVARNDSASPVCLHLQIHREGEKPFYTTHVNLQPGQQKTLQESVWSSLQPAGGLLRQSGKMVRTECEQSPGWW